MYGMYGNYVCALIVKYVAMNIYAYRNLVNLNCLGTVSRNDKHLLL